MSREVSRIELLAELPFAFFGVRHMPDLLTFLTGKRPPEDLEPYVERLYQRRDTSVLLTPATVSDGEWKPLPNECHANVTTFCLSNPKFKIVRGWLYFHLNHELPFERFMAHSAVLSPEGKLYDITPNVMSQQYPFIRAEEGEDEYAALIEVRQVSNLDYFR